MARVRTEIYHRILKTSFNLHGRVIVPCGKPFLQCRRFQDSARQARLDTPAPFAFAFDIDGVLLRSSKPIPGASKALSFLRKNRIPFILLTNGGGKLESDRVAEISRLLELKPPLSESCFIQSHTPFADLVDGDGQREGLRDKCVLVMGGDGDRCRVVAESYGFRDVVTSSDLYHAHPSIWPFSSPFADYHSKHARPLPRPVYTGSSKSTESGADTGVGDALRDYLRIHTIFVFNDPRDWGLDATVLLDLLLSHRGYLGTLSKHNGNESYPNRGYQQDGQPGLWFSNPDLWWAAGWPLPRLGQGGFREAVEGIWAAATNGAELKKTVCGKPYQPTYEYAEKLLLQERESILGQGAGAPERVYMIGDNPASDILGANNFRSRMGSKWESILVQTGVYAGGREERPKENPSHIVKDVWEALRVAMGKEGWETDQYS